MITVRLAEPLRDGRDAVISMNAASLGEIMSALNLGEERDELFNFAVNGALIVHGEKDVALENGDEVEILIALAGG